MYKLNYNEKINSNIRIIYELVSISFPLKGYIKLSFNDFEFGDWENINFLYPVKLGLESIIERDSINNVDDNHFFLEKNVFGIDIGEAFDNYVFKVVKTDRYVFFFVEKANPIENSNQDNSIFFSVEFGDFLKAYDDFAKIFN